MSKKTILVVAAHPDDEILGCGGTIAKLAQTCQVFSVVLGEGVTSRDEQRNVKKRSKELGSLRKQMRAANKVLGVQEVFSYDFPDNRFDSVTLLDIVKKIERLIVTLKPHTIYTHFGHDLNIDHQVTYQAVLTATRPLPGQCVKEIYTFETVSSTEFNYPLSFSPDTFSNIDGHLKTKLHALKLYEDEMRDFPHPRSLKMVELVAQYWGVRSGLPVAEVFETVRKTW